MPDIVTLTLNPALDKGSTVDRIVAQRKLRCSQPTFDPGGGGINVARAIHELGGEATAYWVCGGFTGAALQELLDCENVANVPIPIAGPTRENLEVFETSTGLQFRFGMPGSPLSADDVERCLDALRQIAPPPKYLVLSGSLPPDVPDDLYSVFVEVAPPDCRVVLDTSGCALKQGLQSPVYLIKPNLRELSELAGREIQGDLDILNVARTLIDQGKTQVVVSSLGSGGVMLVTAEGWEHVRAPTVPLRSKVGAGDSTVAGMVLGLSRGLTLGESVRLGVAAGSAAVMTDGTRLCQKADTERLFEEMLRAFP
jgi:6-phosphofructokinase 2